MAGSDARADAALATSGEGVTWGVDAGFVGSVAGVVSAVWLTGAVVPSASLAGQPVSSRAVRSSGRPREEVRMGDLHSASSGVAPQYDPAFIYSHFSSMCERTRCKSETATWNKIRNL